MKKWYKRFTENILSGLLILLGFSSCASKNGENIIYEYGTPTTKFKATGTVTDQAGKPIKGIRVIVSGNYLYFNTKNGYTYADTLSTDDKGAYASNLATAETPNGVKIHFKDIDGEKNGGYFADDSLDINNMKKIKLADGDGKWFWGVYELQGSKKLK